jgi:hypothetical protein
MTHQAATEAAEASRLCEQQSGKHPWVKALKQYRAGVVARLIALCTDTCRGQHVHWQRFEPNPSAVSGTGMLVKIVFIRGSAQHYMLDVMRCSKQSSDHK